MLYRPPVPRVSALAGFSRRVGALAVCVAVIGLVGHRLGTMAPDHAVAVVMAAGGLGLVALILAAAGFAPIWEHGALGIGNVIAAALWGVAAIVPAAALYLALASFPPIADVSTDIVDPPLYKLAPFQRTGDMNRAGFPDPAQLALQRDAYPDITTRRYALGSAQIFRLSHRIALGLGWRIVDELPARDDGDMARLEATARGLLSGVTADIVVRIYADGTGTRIDLRSSSRTGAFDFGENAGRIRDFLSELDHQTGEG
jgi:hypothetical protein